MTELERLQQTFGRVDQARGRRRLAAAITSSYLVRGLVYKLANNHSKSSKVHSVGPATLEQVMSRIALRLLDGFDPAVEQLAQVKDAAQFRIALGLFIRETTHCVLNRTPSTLESLQSPAEQIARVLLASGLDSEVVCSVAKLRSCVPPCLATR
jgi:hypothetical protein